MQWLAQKMDEPIIHTARYRLGMMESIVIIECVNHLRLGFIGISKVCRDFRLQYCSRHNRQMLTFGGST